MAAHTQSQSSMDLFTLFHSVGTHILRNYLSLMLQNLRDIFLIVVFFLGLKAGALPFNYCRFFLDPTFYSPCFGNPTNQEALPIKLVHFLHQINMWCGTRYHWIWVNGHWARHIVMACRQDHMHLRICTSNEQLTMASFPSNNLQPLKSQSQTLCLYQSFPTC